MRRAWLPGITKWSAHVSAGAYTECLLVVLCPGGGNGSGHAGELGGEECATMVGEHRTVSVGRADDGVMGTLSRESVWQRPSGV